MKADYIFKLPCSSSPTSVYPWAKSSREDTTPVPRDTWHGVHRLAGFLLARLTGLGPVGSSLLRRHVPECLGCSRVGASRA
jgi:hypothetical protein